MTSIANHNRTSEVGITDRAPSALPHRLAVALVVATLALVFVGGLVTTQGAGMAFRDWPTSDGQNMFLYPWWKAAGDKFVEHGHRLMGSLVGLLTIALVITLWCREPRAWLRWLGVVALLLVIFQGVLGGLRVRADDVQLARLHGCIGPVFFAVTVALAVFTSQTWRAAAPVTAASAGNFRRLALFTTALAYVQLVIGSQLRHVVPQAAGDTFRLAVMFHLFVALLLLLHGILLARATWKLSAGRQYVVRPAIALVLLLAGQIALGGATWIFKYGWPGGWVGDSAWAAGWTITAGGTAQTLVVTSHVAVGSLILGTALVLALRGFRLFRMAPHSAPSAVGALGVTT